MAIGFAHKYRHDLFLRTEVNTVTLLVLFSTIVLVVVGISTYFLYQDVTSALSDAISESILSDEPSTMIGEIAIERLEELQYQNILTLSAIVIAITIVAGYFVARVVLTPTRNALEFQKQFIGNVAHELRTPLSIIKTSSEVALLDPKAPDDTKKLLKSIIEELNRISNIINNLLSLSAALRPERVKFRDVDLRPIIENSLRTLRGLAAPKQLDIKTHFSERRVVWGNASALEQIVTNIVKNAVMYTPQRGHIDITVEPVYPDFVELTVRDTGIGIARQDLFRIFEPYYRAEQSRARAKGGAGGLGLSIVSELVRLHNGKITVRSVEESGTSVIVLLRAGTQIFDANVRNGHNGDGVGEVVADFSNRR